MALDFPASPSNGDTFLGANGINYIYDSTDGKWEVYNNPASGSNVWSRDAANAILLPVYNGDEILISTNKGRVIRVAVKEIRTAGRNTQGVRIIKLTGDEKVVSADKIDDNLV